MRSLIKLLVMLRTNIANGKVDNFITRLGKVKVQVPPFNVFYRCVMFQQIPLLTVRAPPVHFKCIRNVTKHMLQLSSVIPDKCVGQGGLLK